MLILENGDTMFDTESTTWAIGHHVFIMNAKIRKLKKDRTSHKSFEPDQIKLSTHIYRQEGGT